jgi:hypothetical protein
MFRSKSLIVAWIMALLYPNLALGDDSKLIPGEKLVGEVEREKKAYTWNGVIGYSGYISEIPIELRAGQKITIDGTVTGTGRKISIALVDPTGQVVFTSKHSEVSKTQLIMPEVGATGKYTIKLISDQIGQFTLQATGPSMHQLDKMALKEKIARLEEELIKAKKQLEAMEKESQKTEKP